MTCNRPCNVSDRRVLTLGLGCPLYVQCGRSLWCSLGWYSLWFIQLGPGCHVVLQDEFRVYASCRVLYIARDQCCGVGDFVLMPPAHLGRSSGHDSYRRRCETVFHADFSVVQCSVVIHDWMPESFLGRKAFKSHAGRCSYLWLCLCAGQIC